MFINISNLLMISKSNRGGEHFTSPKKFQHFHQSHLKKKTPQKTRRHLKEFTSLIIIKPVTFEQVSSGIKITKMYK